jgi:23S rRNA pseudouridine2605 synthase
MERLQKIIARAGVSSRRAAEELISSGRVRVNGRVVTELGAKADPRADKIEVDGKRLVAEDPVYIVLHKPRGVVSTLSDPEGRPTVGEMIKGIDVRLYPVGRLDYATSGVLLMTNDGEFANGLLHPRGGVPKTYVLKVQGLMEDADLEPWRTGVDLEDGRTQPADARLMRHEDGKSWLEVTIREGRNQQIRRMGDATGWRVMRLARTSFAGITSEGLRPGEWRALTADELLDIRKSFGVPRKVRSAAARMAASELGGPRPHGTVRRSLSAHRDGDARPAPEARAPRATRGEGRREERGSSGRDSARGAAPARPRAPAPGRAVERREPSFDRERPRDERRPQADRRGPATVAERRARPPRAERTDRSGTTPRAVERRDPRARGRGGR